MTCADTNRAIVRWYVQIQSYCKITYTSTELLQDDMCKYRAIARWHVQIQKELLQDEIWRYSTILYYCWTVLILALHIALTLRTVSLFGWDVIYGYVTSWTWAHNSLNLDLQDMLVLKKTSSFYAYFNETETSNSGPLHSYVWTWQNVKQAVTCFKLN